MTEETKTTDPTTFTFNWHDLRSFDDWENFLSWFLVHLVVPNEDHERTGWYEQLSEATEKFSNVELKITINGIEGNTRHLIETIHSNMVALAQRAAVEELRKVEEFNSLKRSMRALEGAVRDRLESVARGFGLNLEEHGDD